MIICVLGPQGSGKSTQAQLLAQKLNIPHLDTGKLLRAYAQKPTPLGQQLHHYISVGILVPDNIYFPVLEEEIAKPEYQNGFVIDGTPRVLNQAINLPFQVDKVIFVDVSDEVGTERLLKRVKIEHREDDTPETIRRRLGLFHQATEPVLDYYCKQNKLIEINGERPIEVIFADICQKLNLK